MGRKFVKETTEGTTEETGHQRTRKQISKQVKTDTEATEVAKPAQKIIQGPHDSKRAKDSHRIADESTAQIS